MFTLLRVPTLAWLTLPLLFFGGGVQNAVATSYYVDCSASSNGTGSQSSPYNNLASADAVALSAGDNLLFRRGTTCSGTLTMTTSGTAASPISVGAYANSGDSSARPILTAGTAATRTIIIYNANYNYLSDLTVKGSTQYAILAYATGGKMSGTHLTNIEVTAVNKVATKTRDSSGYADSAGIYLLAESSGYFDDVLIDSANVHDATVGEGIIVASLTSGVYNTHVIVRGSTVSNVYGDGILYMKAKGDGTTNASTGSFIYNNTVFATGQCPTCSVAPTPSGVWIWGSTSVVVSNNESYANKTWPSANLDGGAFDSDYASSANTFEFNYGHDSEGYCIMIYGQNSGSANYNKGTTLRYNLCANNLTRITGTGEIYLLTYNSGRIVDAQVYNNTIYFNSAAGNTHSASGNYPVYDAATYSNSKGSFFKNNIVYSLQTNMLRATTGLKFDYNLYYSAAAGYSFKYGSATDYGTFAAYKSGSAQDAHGVNADPNMYAVGYHAPGRPTLGGGQYTLLSGSPALGTGTNVCSPTTACTTGSMGTTDFYGQALPTTHNIGAYD